jgi:hypothetical protein
MAFFPGSTLSKEPTGIKRLLHLCLWHAGSAIALHAKRGSQVKNFCIDAIHELNKDHIEYQFCG